MAIIGNYIRKLLEKGNRVILPGFGNLELVERGDGIPPSGGHVAPPGKTVRFDAGFSKDDGLLAELLAEGEHIDLEEARQRVLELVDAIRFSLDKGEPYTLPGAGTFTRDDEGRIRFRTDPDWTLEPDQFGLEPMDLLELEEEPSAEEVLPGYEAGPTARSEASTGSVPLTRLAAPEKKRRRVNPWRVIWIVAVSLIVILVALIMIPEDSFRGSDSIELKNKVVGEPTPVPEQGEHAGEPADGGESVGSESRQSEDAVVEESAVTPGTGQEEENGEEVTVGEARYYVIAGSFENLANASDLQDRLRARGFPSEVMVTSNRLYRVSVASYASRKDALEGLARIKTTPGLESAWLLSK